MKRDAYKAVLLIFLGVAVGFVSFRFKEAEDASGISLIGILGAFLFIMRGVYYANMMQKGYHIPLVLLVFGVIGIILPIILLLDGEIGGFSIAILIVDIISTALLVTAVLQMKKVKNRMKRDRQWA